MSNQISKRPIQRDSNLELFRCVTMLLIVAHHYVMNSGLLASDGPVWGDPWSLRSLFLLLFGAWGKTGINCFVLITGYYMCQSAITGRKYFRLLAEIYVYRMVIVAIFALTGYNPLTMKRLLLLLLPFTELDRNFTGCFIMFYLFIPFLTIFVKNMTARQHVWLMALSLFIYTILEPLPLINVPMHYVSWFMVLFLVSSFLRLHADEYMERKNNMRNIGGLLLLLIIDIASIIAISWLSQRMPRLNRMSYFFMGESNRPLPFLTSVMAFVFFKRLRLSYIPIINIMGSSTFGVFLIHTRGAAMRRWLWGDLLHNVEMYSSPWLPIHAIGSVLAIFVICVVIDQLRIRFIEPPLMMLFDRLSPFVTRHFNSLEDRCWRMVGTASKKTD